MTKFLAIVLAVALAACAGSAKKPAGPGAAAPTYAAFHGGYTPSNLRPDEDNQAVQVVNAMDAPAAANVMAVYLHDGSEDQLAVYRKTIGSIERAKAGAIIDALPDDVQATGINVLDPKLALDILFYVSEGTYGKISGQVAALSGFTPAAAPAKAPASDPAALAQVAGTYACNTIDGKALPYTIAANGFIIDEAGYVFNADGTYVSKASGHMNGTTTPMEASGTYSVSGTTIELYKSAGVGPDRSSGTIGADGTLSFVSGGMTAVFGKK